MSLEFDDDAPEPRDYTRLMWIGFIVLFVALFGVLYFYSGLSPQVSTVRARHILITFNPNDPGERGRALEQIRDLRKRVLAGEDFATLAETNSNDPASASKGGDIGYVKKGEMTDEIDRYVWAAPIGQLSDVIQTKFGFHIVVVDDRRLSEADALRAKEDEAWQQRLDGGAPAPGDAPPASAAAPAEQ